MFIIYLRWIGDFTSKWINHITVQLSSDRAFIKGHYILCKSTSLIAEKQREKERFYLNLCAL